MQIIRLIFLMTLLASTSRASAPAMARTNVKTTRANVELAMNRLGFGARPSEVERVLQTPNGLEKWINDQLNPKSDDLDLSKHAILTMSLEELQAKYNKEAATDDPEFKPDKVRQAWVNAKIMRAVQSKNQLQERLVDLWYNHFNVDQRKGKDRWSFGPFERDAIRPNIFGKFEDLLRATARHPAMLFYLDNHLNRADTKKKAGINENYARELLELHTLGVSAGYSQKDVTEVARILTGWSINQDQTQFEFKDKQHDNGAKKVMSWDFAADQGEQEGERLLKLLAHHPATARRVSRLIAETFVASPAPTALVDHLTAIYEKTEGDLKALYTAAIHSKEFWSPNDTRVKDHFSWTVSTLRALDGEVLWQSDLANQINNFGEPIYQCAPPTGYTHRNEDLINSGVLVSRLNLALKIAANRIDGVYAMMPKPKAYALRTELQVVDYLKNQIGLARLSQTTTDALVNEMKADSWQTSYGEVRPFVLARMTGLLLASPEFQRHQ